MKRFSYNTFLPEPGEIMKFAEVYGKPAGEGMSKWCTFGTRDKTQNPVAICLELEPFERTETKFLVSANSLMTNILGGPRVLIVSTKPYAEPGDPENVAEMPYGEGELNQGLKFFVNDIPEPPQGVEYVLKWVSDGQGGREQKRVPADAGAWLKPHVIYYITYARVNGVFGESRNNPLSLYVVGTNDPDRGGEVKLNLTEFVGDLDAYEMDLGPLGTGLFIPDEPG